MWLQFKVLFCFVLFCLQENDFLQKTMMIIVRRLI
jgi:hypothetical protein